MPQRTPVPPPPVREGFQQGFDLDGRRAIVYGAEWPVGRAVVEALREGGASVGVTSATTAGEALFALKKAAAGGPSEAVDLSNARNVQVATKKLKKDLGGLDVALVAPNTYFAAPLAKTDEVALAEVIAGNLTAVFNVFRSAGRELQDGESGRLIALLDAPAVRGVANLSAYSAAQAGVVGLVRSVSQEFGRRGVTANALVSGWLESTPGRGESDGGESELLRHIPLRRFGRADEIAPLAVYLASAASGNINGQTIQIDGGLLKRA